MEILLPKRFFGTAAVFALITALAWPAAPRPVEAGFAGPYLAARHASFETDFRQAVRYFERANTQDPGNPQLLEAITASYASLGEMEKAASFADKMIDGGINSQIAHLARMVRAGQNGDFDTVLAQLGAGEDVGPLVDGLVKGWAELGRSDVNAALEAFDLIASERGLQGFANYHKALAMASVGDFESAAAILESDTGAAQATRRGVMAHAQILSQLGRNDEALDLMAQMFTTRLDPGLAALKALMQTHGDLPIVHTTLGDVLRQEKRFEEAVAAYDAAIEIYGEPAPGQWFVYFARAIGHERLGDWPKAEADFRQALELNPDQPQVLNYLGEDDDPIEQVIAIGPLARSASARPMAAA